MPRNRWRVPLAGIAVPGGAAGSTAGALAAPIAVLVLASCGSVDCHGGNDSDGILRSVPAASRVPTTIPGPGEGEVLQETWTIERDGTFILNQKIEKKEGTLGARFATLEPSAAERLGVEPYSGVLVQWVLETGPAGRGGILPDDVIISFAGKEVSSRERLDFLVEQVGPGGPAEVEVDRKGTRIKMKVELGKESQVVFSRALERRLPVIDDAARTGLRLAELTDEVLPLVRGPGAEKGLLVIGVLPGGPGFSADLRVRDCVAKVGARATPTVADYAAALEPIPPGTSVTFTVIRNGQPMDRSVEVEKHASSSWGFDLLGLVKYRKEPERRHFSLLWGLLFNASSCYAVRGEGNHSVNYRERGWGAVLDLIAAKNTPRKKELRLLWLFPITVRSD